MPTFEVTVSEEVLITYTIEASSMADAQDIVDGGTQDTLREFEYSHEIQHREIEDVIQVDN